MTGRHPAHVREAGPGDAADVLAVIHAGFGARRALDPPSTAAQETLGSVADALATHGGLVAASGTQAVGATIFAPRERMLGMRRVAVLPSSQGTGVAAALVRAGERVAGERGYDGVRVSARSDLPETIEFWEHLGYVEVERAGPFATLAKLLALDVVADTAQRTRELGERLAGVLHAGDLVILSGDLGAGKTTFTQGLGAGLQVRGNVTSPTFVIARVHPSLVGGPALVHADAYRLGGIAELDDLDLDTSLEDVVTVVEWGEGVAENLAEDRLEITFTRGHGGDDLHSVTDPRQLRFTPLGARWIGSGLRAVLA